MERTRLDPISYRDAMSRLAGHVQLITAANGGERRGVTVTASCSVSDSPPTVLVCLNGANPRNDIFVRGDSFALNLLGDEHRALAHAFSGRDQLDMDRRFALGQWRQLATGSPILVNATAAFDCRLIEVKTIATHLVLFGEVVDVALGPPRPPLIYVDRGYHSL
ncbi:4-hydroxyphenylacetate 3-monooxygenase [Ensifer sp. Root1252]|nr:4-hydroxyphenylacetate 3-monooxygenase [Ensifer sp. Root1252]KQW74657.1 4-hydroxyphenylacetate 3-monooxygenase [Ensifer sp. Root127]KQY61934.1 4-hydroxyphenylacetate 3-monooxygenase [Ensifer sp. Root142]KRC67788.1 4-hydroxyphenylacetate 3-monooxygenase [Ensifer sp. Root231]KRC98864.1 4-hydroxyphenylacetate 3-monooxygenase [Ensifer sp. Root258]